MHRKTFVIILQWSGKRIWNFGFFFRKFVKGTLKHLYIVGEESANSIPPRWLKSSLLQITHGSISLTQITGVHSNACPHMSLNPIISSILLFVSVLFCTLIYFYFYLLFLKEDGHRKDYGCTSLFRNYGTLNRIRINRYHWVTNSEPLTWW